jgi:hypothetical protein
MPQCQFLVFCYFCVSEKLHRKYSRNRTKQKPKFLFFPKHDGVQSRDGREPEGSCTMPWCRPPPGRAGLWCGPLVHLLTLPFCLYIPLETYCKPPPSSTRDWEGPEALPGTLPERGITTGGLLHHHACLWNDV